MGSAKHHKSSWKTSSVSKSTPWGSEIKWHAIGTISGKCLKISKGCRTSLKYYPLKDENSLLDDVNELLRLSYGDENRLEDITYKVTLYSI